MDSKLFNHYVKKIEGFGWSDITGGISDLGGDIAGVGKTIGGIATDAYGGVANITERAVGSTIGNLSDIVNISEITKLSSINISDINSSIFDTMGYISDPVNSISTLTDFKPFVPIFNIVDEIPGSNVVGDVVGDVVGEIPGSDVLSDVVGEIPGSGIAIGVVGGVVGGVVSVVKKIPGSDIVGDFVVDVIETIPGSDVVISVVKKTIPGSDVILGIVGIGTKPNPVPTNDNIDETKKQAKIIIDKVAADIYDYVINMTNNVELITVARDSIYINRKKINTSIDTTFTRDKMQIVVNEGITYMKAQVIEDITREYNRLMAIAGKQPTGQTEQTGQTGQTEQTGQVTQYDSKKNIVLLFLALLVLIVMITMLYNNNTQPTTQPMVQNIINDNQQPTI
jgi:hypothetical protein